jgi:4a-hydroxytetrahydrobiopterin dehydratase
VPDAAAYGDDEVRARLGAELPRWSLEDGSIRRRYATQGWKSALMVAATVGHLAEVAWHHPEISMSYGWVEVRLMSHDAAGVTERDLALAAKIEEVVCWRPGSEVGPLTGTPDDPRFAYVLPDDQVD